MAEITIPNLRTRLQNNPLGPIIIPAIMHLNDVNSRTTLNPWEALAFGSILANRVTWWNNGNPPASVLRTERCYCPPGDVTGGDCELVPVAAYNCGNKQCDNTSASSSSRTSTSGGPVRVDLVEDLIVEGARTANLPHPYTPAVREFEQLIAGISMNGPGDWLWFQMIVDVFYENVNFMDYFTIDYLNGTAYRIYMAILGGTYRDEYQPAGLDMGPYTDGSAGTPATAGETSVTFNSVDISQDGSFFLMTKNATEVWQIWFDLSAGVAPALAVVPGYTVLPIQVTVDPGLTPADFATAVSLAFGGIPGFASIVPVGDTVTWMTSYLDTRLASDFSEPVFVGEWSGAFVDGTPLIPGTEESVEIDYTRALSNKLVGRWFILNDGATKHFFYYQKEGWPTIIPAEYGVPYDFAHAILIANTPCPPPQETQPPCIEDMRVYSQQITTAAILATGFWTQSYQDGLTSRYSTVAVGDSPAPDPGTANYGDAYQVNALVAPNGDNLGGNYVNDSDYVYAWNTIMQEYMNQEGRGGTYYLRIGAIAGGICKKAPVNGVCPCGTPVLENDIIKYCRCEPCPNATGNMLMRVSYPSDTDHIEFGTAGSTFATTDETKAPGALI